MTRKLPWMKFYGAWFYEDERTRELPLEAQALLLRALWIQWEEGSLPLDPDELRDKLDPRHETGERFEKLWSMVEDLFVVDGFRMFEPLHENRRSGAMQKRASKRRGPSDEARSVWEKVWEELVGLEWTWTTAQERALSECVELAEGDLSELERRARIMFGRKDAWTLENATPRLLASRWNPLAYEVKDPKRNAAQLNLDIIRDSARKLGILSDFVPARPTPPKPKPEPGFAEAWSPLEKLMGRAAQNHRQAEELDEKFGGRDRWPQAFREQYERAQARLASDLEAYERELGSEPHSEPFRTVQNLNPQAP